MKRMLVVGMLVLGAAVSQGAAPAEAQKKDRYRLTLAEIDERQDLVTAHDAIRQLRSQWLKPARPRGDFGSGAAGAKPYRPKPEAPGAEGGAQPQADPGAAAAAAMGDASRAPSRRVDPVVYIDDARQSEMEESLRSVQIAEVLEIRYMGGTEAIAKLGPGHEAGAILITTRRAVR